MSTPQKKVGRPKGSLNKRTLAMQYAAKQSGMLPHEFLLSVMRGEAVCTPIKDPVTGETKKVYETPTFDQRLEAAKAAAPYFAPRLNSVDVNHLLRGASDDDLDRFIAGAAAAAGVSISPAGEGAQEEAERRPRVRITPT